jgi:hemerythrin-like domain-containing protein
MSNTLPGHASPAGGFEVPLEMLSACHDRVQRQCTTLRRLVAHLTTHGADADARAAATAVLRHFDTAARDHHADEESDLFPALIEAMAGSDAICLREMIDALVHDHRALESSWMRLRPALQSVAVGDSPPLAAAEVEALVTLYERHIEREESELLPMAARLLDDAALERVGKAMRERRGIAAID